MRLTRLGVWTASPNESRTKIFKLAHKCALRQTRSGQLSPLEAPLPPPNSVSTMPLKAVPHRQALVAAGNTLKAAVATVVADTGLRGPAWATAYRRHRTDAGTANRDAVLTQEQEQVLVGVAQEFSINDLPYSRPQLQALVNSRFGAAVSSEWVNR